MAKKNDHERRARSAALAPLDEGECAMKEWEPFQITVTDEACRVIAQIDVRLSAFDDDPSPNDIESAIVDGLGRMNLCECDECCAFVAGTMVEHDVYSFCSEECKAKHIEAREAAMRRLAEQESAS
jgi:hypothetical protein